MRYHVHVYRILDKAETNVDAEDSGEAKRIALAQHDDLDYGKSECNYIALEFFGESNTSCIRSK